MAKYGVNKPFEPCPACPSRGECRREQGCRLEAVMNDKMYSAPPKDMRDKMKVRRLMNKQRGSNV